jgi:hypothetical protein
MIKLKELIELKSMVYTEEVKPKHQKRMDRTTEVFWNTLSLPFIKPPENDHSITLGEVKYLKSIKPNKDFVKEGDDIREVFKPLIEKYDVNISEKYIDKILKESNKFIYQLKYLYNRPRPHQIAEFYDIKLNGVELDSMNTPSYPSGHATQGYLVGEILSRFDPQNAVTYRQKAEDIAHSRIVAKAHYPSDKRYGKKISKVLFTGIRKWSV